jgi:hypothetical protein
MAVTADGVGVPRGPAEEVNDFLSAGRVCAARGHRTIPGLHAPMISGGRACPSATPRQQDPDLRPEC